MHFLLSFNRFDPDCPPFLCYAKSAALSGVLLILFGGVTDRLIPLFAVGAFLVFTISRAGMVGHWRRVGGNAATRSIFVNGLGAVATGVTVVLVLVAKFTQGAWLTVLLIPGLLLIMGAVRRHYHRVFLETHSVAPLELNDLTPPLVIVPIRHWSHIVKRPCASHSRFRRTCEPCTWTVAKDLQHSVRNCAGSLTSQHEKLA